MIPLFITTYGIYYIYKRNEESFHDWFLLLYRRDFVWLKFVNLENLWRKWCLRLNLRFSFWVSKELDIYLIRSCAWCHFKIFYMVLTQKDACCGKMAQNNGCNSWPTVNTQHLFSHNFACDWLDPANQKSLTLHIG